MADRGDTHYHVSGLNRWFAFSSVALLLSALWMVWKDFDRPWKTYQREFRAMEIERGRAALDAPEAVATLAEEEQLAEELRAEQKRLDAQGGLLARAKKELILLEDALDKADAAARVAKQEAAWERFLTDEKRLHHGADSEQYRKGLEGLARLETAMLAADDELKNRKQAYEDKEAEIEALRSGVAEIEARMKAATRSIELTRRQLASIDPKDKLTQLANLVRDDIPGLDFVGPSLRVMKSMPPALTFELNFTKKPRIDMCQTCHVPIDKEGWEENPVTGEAYAHPFRTHPRLDLFLTAKSPHPMSQMGCTVCHRGAGEALVFQRVDHRANDEQQAEQWSEEHGWHKQHYWDYPMLPRKYVEAGCVQCHKDSMELIEPEAPKVAEGYRLFERYGCYACHKVDWFPTKRRPGPTLTKILEKTTPEFVSAWVTDPKAFRPTTWMPQMFHLENVDASTKIVQSELGTGRAMMGDEWSDAAIASIVAFLESRSRAEPLPAIPVEGDPLRGSEVFRLSGCLACHNLAPYGEAERAEATDPAEKLRDTNEHGPNLRGIATKTTPEWLFAWIRDPHAWWSETRMPDLRLPDQDVADIVAYVFEDPDGIFHDVPEGWATGRVEYDRDVLEEQARWFFNRLRKDELDARFAVGGEWGDDQDLLVAMGERWVLAQGCHSCHEIPGLETANPIGTELSTWASKTVDKLDFGFIPELMAKERGHEVGSNEFHHFVYEFKQYRENFLEQKLRAPRSYDRGKVKNPSERLKMPWFDFTEDEIESLTTFVAGLVEDEVARARMVPTPENLAMDTGLRVIRQKNCAACHVIEPGTIDWTDANGVHRSVRGDLATLEGELFPPPMSGLREYLDDYVEFMREEDDEFELEELYARLLETDVELGDVGRTFAIEDVDGMSTKPRWGGDFVDVVMKYYVDPYVYDAELDDYVPASGDPEGEGRIQDVDGEWRDFSEEVYEKLRWTYAPPVLIGEGEKLQRDWFYRFLLDPYELRQQIRVKMPTFYWAPGEAGAVADYFASKAKQEWPQEYARQMQRRLGEMAEQIAQGIAALGLPGSSTAQIQGISDGLPVETQAGLPNLLAYGASRGFAFDLPVDPSYESIPQRTPEWLAHMFERQPDLYATVHTLATGPDGPKCNQCHFVAGERPTNEAPVGWAPDLIHTRERLRPDWVRRWLTDPSKIYPGTTMPANFDLSSTQWQDLYPAPSAEQIEGVTTWLFNLDRALLED